MAPCPTKQHNRLPYHNRFPSNNQKGNIGISAFFDLTITERGYSDLTNAETLAGIHGDCLLP